MSITRVEAVDCARCGARVELRLVDSLNAGRHPHLRRLLLDRALHAFACPACGDRFTVEQPLFYFDLERRQFFGAYPLADLAEARPRAEEVLGSFERWMVERAPEGVRRLAPSFLVRVCFGYEELREKVVADEAGLNDLVLEALKGEILRGAPGLAAAGVATLRLDALDGDELVLIPDALGAPPPLPPLRVPRADYDAVDARRGELLALRPGLASGPHCSLLRLAREGT